MDDDAKVLDEAARLSAAGRRFALVTVVRTGGSTPRKAGAKMVVRDDGSIEGTVGGGALELWLIDEARAAIEAGEPRLARRHLTRELAMCCGGEVEAFVDPMGRRERLVLVGGGHVNRALAPLGAALGFEVWVVDDLEEAASPERFPGATRLVHSWQPNEWGAELGRDAYVVIATRDHAVDQGVLEQLARLGATPAYLGVISSRAKMARFRKRLEAKGVGRDWVARVRGPIGVAIGAETPAEIAVSVAAELVAVRRGVATAVEAPAQAPSPPGEGPAPPEPPLAPGEGPAPPEPPSPSGEGRAQLAPPSAPGEAAGVPAPRSAPGEAASVPARRSAPAGGEG
ncbi:MAG TPA: xanthine dehydrogenase accessory protein XdhC [Polyangiaceae bacterium]|nr:xanthine dehydrogenase accessory protein XdhC [Polyangiaceae bacterium]